MSYSFHPYAVPAGYLQKIRGSKDQTLLSELTSKLSKDLKDNDEFFEDMEDEEPEGEMTGCLAGILKLIVGKEKFAQQQEKAKASGPFPTSAELLASFINGDQIDLRCGSKMGYVLKMVCEVKGKFLLNAGLESIRRGNEVAAGLEETFKQKGIQIKLAANMFDQEGQLGIPSPDDFPGVGFLPLSMWEAVDHKLQAIDTSGAVLPSYMTSDDDDDEEDDEDYLNRPPTDYGLLMIKSIQEWSRHSVENKCDIVTFYH